MFIDDWVLCSEGWEEVEGLVAGASPTECLIEVWKTTPSLRWLQVCRSDLPRANLGRFEGVPERAEVSMDEEQSRLAADQTFLPQLACAIYYQRLRLFRRFCIRNPFGFLTRSRPGMFCSSTCSAAIVVTIDQGSQTDVLETSLAFSDSEESHRGICWHRVAGFIENSLQASPHWRASPPLLIVSCYNLGSSFNTQNVYPWMAKLITKIRPANTFPSLKRLMFRFDGLITPDEVFKLDGQNSFFELINQVSPGINGLLLKFRGLALTRWIKTLLTLKERRSHPDFPYWVPVLSSLKNETYAWWIELLNLDSGFMGMPKVDDVQTMALELNWRFQLAYSSDELNQGLIARDLAEYYARKFPTLHM